SGGVEVAPSGAGNYSIPIQVTPAVAGLVPQLALTYDSQRSSGIAGVGWDLAGLSAITRCSQDPLSDPNGKRLPVAFTGTDRFCLDGQRLQLVSGTPGADDSTYRTEMDD